MQTAKALCLQSHSRPYPLDALVKDPAIYWIRLLFLAQISTLTGKLWKLCVKKNFVYVYFVQLLAYSCWDDTVRMLRCKCTLRSQYKWFFFLFLLIIWTCIYIYLEQLFQKQRPFECAIFCKKIWASRR